MVKTIEELLTEREDAITIDLRDYELDKLIGEPGVGKFIYIQWDGRYQLMVDEGYSFSLPGCKVDELDFFIHIPSPKNSEGIGSAPEVFVHIAELLSIREILKVTFKLEATGYITQDL